MAKRKRKISATQRDKKAIETAKYLKRIGVLSPQTKLHGGKYVSRSVLKKTRELGWVAELKYTTFHVSKKTVKGPVKTDELIERLRSKDFAVARGRNVIIPRDHRWRAALKEGHEAGVFPVRQGAMEVIPVPVDYFGFIELLNNPDELNKLKLDNEVFAFSFFGNMGYGTFSNAQLLRQHGLEHYLQKLAKYAEKTGRISKEDAEEPEGLVITRLNPADTRHFIKSRDRREKALRAKRRKPEGERRARRRTPRDEMLPAKAERLRREERERQRKRAETMTEAQREKSRQATRNRVAKYRQKLKDAEKK